MKDNIKECQTKYSESKKALEKYKEERGKPEASAVAEVEQHLEWRWESVEKMQKGENERREGNQAC